jgi:hypothetical protein
MHYKNKLVLALLLLFLQLSFAQQGGMWVPSLLDGTREKEMKKLGLKISLKDIYDTNKSSLKDAVPQFNGGCTAEVISPNGLLLTNHHCGFDEIQSHSSVEKDYITNGFWAYSLEEELPNPNLEVTFIISITDVTTAVLEGVADLNSEVNKQQRIKENIAKVQKETKKESWQGSFVRSFFDGNQYLLFVTESYEDVRLVGAPPSSIGKFGSDTDNWVWPRHTGDFSLFRIYADKNNRPAKYSKDNVPYKPKHYFPISIAGVKDNDFTMVMGYPGRTQEYLPAVAVEQIVNDLNPARIKVREQALKVQDGFMRKNQAIKIQYAAKYAAIANYWKKWIGESQGLKKSDAVGKKRSDEEKFKQLLVAKNQTAAYGNLLSDFEKYYGEIKPYAVARDYFNEIFLRNTELTSTAFKLYQLTQMGTDAKSEAAFEERRKALINGLPAFYKDFNLEVDQQVFNTLIGIYLADYPKAFLPEKLKNETAATLTEKLYQKSAVINYEQVKTLLTGSLAEVKSKLNADPGVQLMTDIAFAYTTLVAPKYDELNTKITATQKQYTKALYELKAIDRMFPDANSTLRITYGKVKGYQPKDATLYTSKTYLDGVLEKYIPGDYEFDVPQKLIELYEKKDYGAYAENGKMPVCFIGTNHTTGGNSGSPALDAKGNLIGLNFDRVWEGTMSDIYYDPAICRNVMVDARYILFIIDKFANAQNLINELKIIGLKK